MNPLVGGYDVRIMSSELVCVVRTGFGAGRAGAGAIGATEVRVACVEALLYPAELDAPDSYLPLPATRIFSGITRPLNYGLLSKI